MSAYAKIAADTLEYQQGHNSAEINIAVAYGDPISNPYPINSKAWLDWQIGYESWGAEIDAEDETAQLMLDIVPTFSLDNLWG